MTGDGHLSAEFATSWPAYDLDPKTRALLAYATKLTQTPSTIGDADYEELHAAGWGQAAIDHATAMIAYFNMSGRLEAASGLSPDVFSSETTYPESNPNGAP